MTTRQHYSEKMNTLQRTIVHMGTLVVRALELSMQALMDQDEKIAGEIIESDQSINNLEIEINNQCTTLIAEEQPLAKDLRIILNAIRASHSLERIGDNAVHIAKSTILLSKEPYMKPLIDIPRMAEIAIAMVKESLDAYIQLNQEGAVEISRRDNRVDDIYSQIFRELITYMHEDPGKISQAMTLLFICRRLERVADHATHIWEGVVFVATGTHGELNR